MTDGSLIVAALGGNAISLPDEEGNVDQQFTHSRETAVQLADLVEHGNRLVITHGNGPQIGNFLLRNQAAAHLIYPLPFQVAGSHVQGGMGFMIAQTLKNELTRRGLGRAVTAVITTVRVDRNDPSFDEPTKPIGRMMTRPDVDRFARPAGWQVKEVSHGEYRRIIASPDPLEILEIEHIRRSVEAGELVVACGGGGIPLVRDDEGCLYGVRAVVDKDLASALLANQLRANLLMILTNVERVCVDYRKPTQRAIERTTVSEARCWLEAGQFEQGSMGPKIDGAIRFLEDSPRDDARVIIGPLDRAADAFAGRTGTVILKDTRQAVEKG